MRKAKWMVLFRIEGGIITKRLALLRFFEKKYPLVLNVAGWSSPVARQAHNLKVAGSNPAPAPNKI